MFQSVWGRDEADVAVFLDLPAHPPVGVKLLEDVQIVPDLEADGAAMDGTLVVQRAVVHDVGPHREGDLSEE